MKVAFISAHSFVNPGGVKSHILGLKENFQRRGISVKIIVPRRKKSEDYGKEIILLGTSFPLYLEGTQTDFIIHFNPLAIERILKREKFDILHFHNFLLPGSWQILEKSHSLNILTLHANIEESRFFQRFPGILSFWRKIIKEKMDGLIGVSSLALKGFENFKGPKTIIPNGIDLEKFHPHTKKIEKFLDGKINILFVGRLEERKGLIYLLEGYQILQKEFPNLRLIVVGEGPLKKKYENFVRKNNLREVYFEGKKTEEELVSYYNSADIFVSPAIFGESFGIVLLEAMACQKPVVAFANPGYKEFLKDKKGGILVENHNGKDLAEKIALLIKNPQLRKRMGKEALKEVKEYSWQKIAQKILNFYELCKNFKI